MNLVLGGLCEPLLVTNGFGGSGSIAALTFRQTLVAKLLAIPELTAVVGTHIYPGAVPQNHDFGARGPALVYTIPTYPRSNVLATSDGTGAARVQFSVFGYQLSAVDAATLAIFNALDGPPVNPWANGGVAIMSCSHQDEHDQHEQPKSGSDQWLYSIVSEYLIRHRLTLPTLS